MAPRITPYRPIYHPSDPPPLPNLGSPFKLQAVPPHDASRVLASGPGLSPSGVPASLPVEFAIDARGAGQGVLTVQILVCGAGGGGLGGLGGVLMGRGGALRGWGDAMGGEQCGVGGCYGAEGGTYGAAPHSPWGPAAPGTPAGPALPVCPMGEERERWRYRGSYRGSYRDGEGTLWGIL